MDLKNLKKIAEEDEKGVVTIIYQRNGEPYTALDGSDSTMTILGSESKAYRKAKRATMRRMLNLKRNRVEVEEVEANRIAQAAAAVTEWHGWDDGKVDLPCKREHVEETLVWEHILEQVEAAIKGHSDFSSGSSPT